MNVVIVTDTWRPQVNGVVRTLEHLIQELEGMGLEVVTITPQQFRSIPCPTYPELRLAFRVRDKMAALLDGCRPFTIHIATEGPLGLAARRYCLRRGVPFTTAFHTRFPDYVHARAGVPKALTFRVLRWFHAPAARVMVATESLRAELAGWGFGNLALWSRGVDVELFRPRPKEDVGLARPLWLYVGRVAVEKNLPAFLGLQLPGSKMVVGDGPQLEELRRRHPEVCFTGARSGLDLARAYAAADVFVFPSRTDTFGLVLLEALASGLPVAAYPVAGPLDVIGAAPVGCLDEDLGRAARQALAIPPERCRAYALRFSWTASAQQFLRNQVPAPEIAPARAVARASA
jgi:glycosyltransferase involved in cell wall biosynthesis